MKYSEFYDTIFPVINARWNSMLYSKEWISSMVNLSIQQIYNEYRWSFLYVSESILSWNATTYLDRYKYNLLNKVKLPISLSYLDWDRYIDMGPAKSLLDLDKTTFLVYNDELYFKELKDYLFCYYKQYKFINYLADTWVELQIPDSFIPALYYLVLSQIDMIYVQQADWEYKSNFNKYQYEIDKLKKDDLPPAIWFTWVNYK